MPSFPSCCSLVTWKSPEHGSPSRVSTKHTRLCRFIRNFDGMLLHVVVLSQLEIRLHFIFYVLESREGSIDSKPQNSHTGKQIFPHNPTGQCHATNWTERLPRIPAAGSTVPFLPRAVEANVYSRVRDRTLTRASFLVLLCLPGDL